jgi:nitrous oxidase accessory protein NosD
MLQASVSKILGRRGTATPLAKKEVSVNTKRIGLHIGLTLVFLGTVCVTGSAWTRTVGKETCPKAQYATITAAVNAAAPGDIIDICPDLYTEQLIITKPLTLRGVSVDVNGNNVKRVLLQPVLQDVDGLPVEAVITVMNTWGVTIENLAIDASKNSVHGCTPQLADIHFYNASGRVANNALFGAQLANPQSCVALFPGNGFGVLVDSNKPGPFHVSVEHNSIHDFRKDGVQAVNAGVTVEVEGNSISGIGPSIPLQFGVFIVNGAVGLVKGNVITEGLCGTLSPTDCGNARSEGVTLRKVGNGTVVNNNVINNAQSGIFMNGGNKARITDNLISKIEIFDGIDIQFFTNSLIDDNTIFNAAPIDNDHESCGVFEFSGTGDAGNTISHTTVNDAYCGVFYVTADHVGPGNYNNTLYTTLNGDLFPTAFPPPREP